MCYKEKGSNSMCKPLMSIDVIISKQSSRHHSLISSCRVLNNKQLA